MKNKIEDVRNHLFMALERLNDEDEPISDQELKRAKTIADVSQVIINSAKIEVDYLKATKRKQGTGFIPAGEPIELQAPEKKGLWDEV
jgi:hypothetical protein